MGELLRSAGHEVHTAADGVVGIALARRTRPDIVIVDIGLPFMDGYEVGQRLRALCGDAVRLIAVTGSEERARSAEAGFDVHLMKPMNPATLLQAISAR